MCNSTRPNRSSRHSLYSPQNCPATPNHKPSNWRSDVNITPLKKRNYIASDLSSELGSTKTINNSFADYYKRYEHDEVPVKDDSNYGETSDASDATPADHEVTSNSDDSNKNVSQQLQTDESLSSLESNIKFFKATVEEIFKKFYLNMKDYEMYKQKYQDILKKNQKESADEMENFIRDMIRHIMSSDTSISEDRRWSAVEARDKATNFQVTTSSNATDATTSNEKLIENLHSVVEAYKNENYLTDSYTDEHSSNGQKIGEIFNIYLLSSTPYLQIKMNERNLLSEINIKDLDSCADSSQVASADNLKRVAAKKLEMERYSRTLDSQDDVSIDREIPVKIAFAKKNIHLDEDFERIDVSKSFMAKICNYICKRFRKNSFG